jgi:hypothetical protein
VAVNNAYEFCQAFAGAMSGMGISGRPVTSPEDSAYEQGALVAYAFATEFDDQWGSNNPDQYQLTAIAESCEGYFRDRGPNASAGSTEPTSYSIAVAAIIASILEGSAELSDQGVSPPPYPPTGGATLPLLILTEEDSTASPSYVTIASFTATAVTANATNLFVAAMMGAGSDAGNVDLQFDGSSVLSEPISVPVASGSFYVFGMNITTPLVAGQAYQLKANSPGGGGGQAIHVMNAYIF